MINRLISASASLNYLLLGYVSNQFRGVYERMPFRSMLMTSVPSVVPCVFVTVPPCRYFYWWKCVFKFNFTL